VNNNNIFVSDLHGNQKKFKKLFKVIREKQPDGVFIGGDILPNHLAINEPMEQFIDSVLFQPINEYKKTIKKKTHFFIILGNDDPKKFEYIFINKDRGKLIDYIHFKTIPYHDFFVTGYSFIPPTPFQLKDWERYDVSRFVDVGCVSPEEGIRTEDIDPDEIKYATIKKDISKLIQNAPPQKTIFLFHTPPYKTYLDRAALDGKTVDYAPIDVHIGSVAIMDLIKKHQPMLTLHGHVHETVKLTGNWKQQFQNTISITGADQKESLSLVYFNTQNLENATRETFLL